MRLPTLAVVFMLLGLFGAAALAGSLRGRPALQRDVEGYAVAACFARQREPLLKAQGYAWASAIVQRSHGKIDSFTAVGLAVDAALKAGAMPVGHDDATGKDFAMPLARCGDIIDEARVATAISTAQNQLARAYRRK